MGGGLILLLAAVPARVDGEQPDVMAFSGRVSAPNVAVTLVF